MQEKVESFVQKVVDACRAKGADIWWKYDLGTETALIGFGREPEVQASLQKNVYTLVSSHVDDETWAKGFVTTIMHQWYGKTDATT